MQRQKSFADAQATYETENPDWETNPAALWHPTKEFINTSNLHQAMIESGFTDYKSFHHWSHTEFKDFWQLTLDKLNIQFSNPYTDICDLTQGVAEPKWLPNAKLNIIDSCFNASPDAIAIIYEDEHNNKQIVSYKQLNKLSNQVANSLIECGFKQGDAIAIDMLMDVNAVAIYLGIIKAGMAVVSIADSFAANEIASRLKIANAKAIFTQDFILRAGKELPLYEKVIQAASPKTIVIATKNTLNIELREHDLSWHDFLVANTEFTSIQQSPAQAINILFSSGTTGDPKAIPWDHSTAIKAAMDAYFHHDIKPNDILAWPTNLGWMMGPWLIFAGLINQATIALYGGAPTSKAFGEFVQNNKVTMLGLVPSIVNAWRSSQCMQGLDWSALKCFSSSGECSNIQDMHYLMWLANYKPIIEYCGGTEIGGGYITSTLIEANAPATFTTPALGVDFVLLDAQGHETNNGEVALIPPSMGLSTRLLNRDHYQVYFQDMPKSKMGKVLRRHGDQIEKVNALYYKALGRVDDTMNLSGIKTSSAEIERTVNLVDNVLETAAIGISAKGGGPKRLVIYAVLDNNDMNDKSALQQQMQQMIKAHLNPLFKIYDVVITNNLPRTASNKIMRRVLRDQYIEK